MFAPVTRCQACRNHVLDAFVALAGISMRPPPLRTPPRVSRSLPSSNWRRNLATTPKTCFGQPIDNGASREGQSQNDDEATTTEKSSATPSKTPLPWYLQVQTPEPPASISRLQALEEIPPIPPDAPDILHPILSHLSTQIGLDNLTLLDLRDVYPPPALGSNLLMILGTARSYKHLNTSADRFCRWLRSHYKLSPFADGLLGRNELKLKLRRKARRMKLAQSVGNTVAMGATGGGDDGITTGWVCVNIGAVDDVKVGVQNKIDAPGEQRTSEAEQEETKTDEEEYANPVDDSGIIGFGTKDGRTRIVVQMFLEEKRVEMDLEGLWDVRVQRRDRKAEKIDRTLRLKEA